MVRFSYSPRSLAGERSTAMQSGTSEPRVASRNALPSRDTAHDTWEAREGFLLHKHVHRPKSFRIRRRSWRARADRLANRDSIAVRLLFARRRNVVRTSPPFWSVPVNWTRTVRKIQSTRSARYRQDDADIVGPTRHQIDTPNHMQQL